MDDETIEDLENRLKTHPDDRNARLRLARLYLEKDEYHRAVEHYKQLSLSEHERPEVHEGLALAYSGLGWEREAQKHLKLFEKIKSDAAPALQHQMTIGQLKRIKERQKALMQDEMMATLGSIARGAAHEFRTPLQVIQAKVDFANRYLLKKNPTRDDLQKVFSVIETQVGRMTGLVRHIQKLASGDKTIKSSVNVNEVINSALDLQRRQLAAHDIQIHQRLAEKPPLIMANPFPLEQAFLNLLLNSKAALETVSEQTRIISIRTLAIVKKSREIVVVEFGDNGPGVPEENRERIFEPFFTTREPGKGMGLGLSFVRDALSEVGGSIRLNAGAERGAHFIIELPVYKEEGNATSNTDLGR